MDESIVFSKSTVHEHTCLERERERVISSISYSKILFDFNGRDSKRQKLGLQRSVFLGYDFFFLISKRKKYILYMVQRCPRKSWRMATAMKKTPATLEWRWEKVVVVVVVTSFCSHKERVNIFVFC